MRRRAVARGRYIMSSPPDDVEVFALDRFGIEIENLRTNASYRLLSGIASALDPSEGRAMRVASWRDGGEPKPTRIAIFAPYHRFRRGRPKHVPVVRLANRRLAFASHFRLGFEPVIETATILLAMKHEELISPFPNLLSNLSSKLGQFSFFRLVLFSCFFIPSSLPPLNAWRWVCTIA